MIFQESKTVELKSIVVDDIKKEIIAFANCEGGKLYVGVQDDGEVVGIDNPDEAALQISNMIRDAIKPDLTLFLHYKTIQIKEKNIIEIDIQQGTQRPYYIAKKGLRPEGVYVRQGYSSVPASQEAIRRMIKETYGDCFENMRSLDQNLTFKAAEKEFAEKNILFQQAQMKTLGIMSYDGVYTNLGLLLSDQCVHTIKAAVFAGTNQNEFKDRKEFSGSLFQQMKDAYDFIDFRNQIHSTFVKLRRIDTRDYPEVAVREALLNLLIHREYAIRASAFISIYSDRIECTSIGGLVSGVTLKDVMMGISVCRNEKLANIFYHLEFIEAYGTGIRKIMDAYLGTGKEPRIETSDNAFKITLPNLNVEIEQAVYPVDKQEDNKQKDTILTMAQHRRTFTRNDVEKILGVSQATSVRLLKQMIEQKEIVKEGKGRNTCYRLLLQNRKEV